MTQKGRTYSRFSRFGIAVLTASLCLVAAPAYAQDKPASDTTETLPTNKVIHPTEGLSFNLPTNPGFQSSPGLQLELPLEAVGSTLFKLDMSNGACVSGQDGCVKRDGRTNLGLTDTFTRRSEKGIDFALTPRAAVRFGDESNSAVVGAVIEIGKDLREGSEFENNTWYFFAGADAEALTYLPNSVNRITSGQFHLQDRIIVGDAQAGLGYRIGDADVSLSYMRREASTEEFSFKEDAAALSFTWKR